MPIEVSVDQMICIHRNLAGALRYLETEADDELLLTVWLRVERAYETDSDKDLTSLGYRCFLRYLRKNSPHLCSVFGYRYEGKN